MPTFKPRSTVQLLNHHLGPVFILNRPVYWTTIFTSGDTIKGKIRVKTFTKAERVTVSFIGSSSCSKDDNTILFSYTDTLFSGPGTIPDRGDATHVDYPFEFRFPDYVELEPGQLNGAVYNPSTLFEHQPGHILPPSMWAEDGIVKVEYYVEAQIVAPHLFLAGKTKVQQQLRFTPSVLPSNSIPQLLAPCLPVLVQRRTRFLLPTSRSEDAHPNRFTRLKDVLHKNDQPYATFSITTNIPSEIRVGEAIPMSISLVHCERSEELRDPPAVFLRGIAGKATMHIYARVPLTTGGNINGEQKSETEEDVALFSYTFGSLQMTNGMTIGDLVVRKDVGPGYKSYGVAATHDLHLKLEIECAGNVSEVNLVRKNINLLPMSREGRGMEEGMDLPGYEEEEGPPPYEE
jgi:hypothetical protein